MNGNRNGKFLTALLCAVVFSGTVGRAGQDREIEVNRLFQFVDIPAGAFVMGCSPSDTQCDDDEKPPHEVQISKGFQIGKNEVTQAVWESVMGSNPSDFKSAERPVEWVSWNDTQEFLQRLNKRNDGYRYRLPTEAEWEYAARAGSKAASTGQVVDIDWFQFNAESQTHPVGQKHPNNWGLYDVQGNVWEWVADWYDEGYYRISPVADPSGPSTGELRVMRGGSWGSIRETLGYPTG